MFRKMLCLLCAFGFLTAFNGYADENAEVASNDEVVTTNDDVPVEKSSDQDNDN